MRTFYTLVIAGIIAVVAIFIASFFFIDTAKHKTYHYTVNIDGFDVGTVKVERFETEAKIVYKSVSNIPFKPGLTESRIRLDLDRRYGILNYTKEDAGNGAKRITALENTGDDNLSFLSIDGAIFSYTANIPTRKNVFLFDEEIPLMYLPLVENYNFRRGRSQAFMCLVPFSPLLPPAKMFVTLTSINDEYVKMGKRELKTEHMLVKMRNYPQGSIWVSKTDHNLVALEIPKMGLRIMRTEAQYKFEPKDFVPQVQGYTSKDVEFKNENTRLAATFSTPDKEGAFPTVLLVPGTGPYGRDCMGLFASLADYLTRNGFCVLRYDNRGTGQSTGETQSSRDSDRIDDCVAALDFLSSQKEVDPQKISMIGHLDGAYFAAAAAAREHGVERLILMSPIFFPEKLYDSKFRLLKNLAVKYGWSGEYLKTSMRTIFDTTEKARAAKDVRTPILGYKCFVGNVDERARADSFKIIDGLNIPVLILQTADEDVLNAGTAGVIDESLTARGKTRHMLVYFSYLGPWFGQKINDGVYRMRYSADSTVLQSIRDWINMEFAPKLPEMESAPSE